MKIKIIFNIILLHAIQADHQGPHFDPTYTLLASSCEDSNITELTNAKTEFIIRNGNLQNELVLVQLRFVNYSTNCNKFNTSIHTLHWKDDVLYTPKHELRTRANQTRKFQTGDDASKYVPPHFLEGGTFFNGKYYFHSIEGYCIHSWNNNSISVRTCLPDQETEILLPKCCALDEVIYRKRTCQKYSPNQAMWKPDLYFGGNNGRFKPFEYKPKHLNMFLEDLTSPCRKLTLESNPSFTWWSPTGMGTNITDKVKLVIKPGTPKQVFPLVFHSYQRKWSIRDDVHFCIDGTYITTKWYPENERTVEYTAKPEDYVIYFCRAKQEQQFQNQSIKTWIHAITSLVTSSFLLATVVVYLVLISKHNLHGLMVLMYSASMLVCYAFACVSSFMVLHPSEKVMESQDIGWSCYIVAVLRHYFNLAIYMWLTIMNANFAHTFRKIQAVKSSGKRLKKFAVFCVVAWGVPGHGNMICFVARPFRGYYLYLPNGIMIAINIPLMLVTFRVFWKARDDRAKMQIGTRSTDTGQSAYSAALFLKLFLIMGGNYLIGLLTWYYHDAEEDGNKPIWLILIEAGGDLTPVLLFYLFCLNPKIKSQLKEKFANVF